MRVKEVPIPKFHELMNPLIRALHDLGGSGSVDELYERVVQNEGYPDHVLDVPHNPEKSNQSEVEYRLAWARTYLRKVGLIDNSARGVWVIVPEKREIKEINPRAIVRAVREQDRRDRKEREADQSSTDDTEDVPEEAKFWRTHLHHVLTKVVDPDGFERIAKRLLRESGFVHVEVTGRSGDGGIDGKGIIRVAGLLSFHCLPMQAVSRRRLGMPNEGFPRGNDRQSR